MENSFSEASIVVPPRKEQWVKSSNGYAKWHRVVDFEAYETHTLRGQVFVGVIVHTVCKSNPQLTACHLMTDNIDMQAAVLVGVCPKCAQRTILERGE